MCPVASVVSAAMPCHAVSFAPIRWRTTARFAPTPAVAPASAILTSNVIVPPVNTQFQAVFAGAPDLGPATTQPVRVVVRQLALLRPTNAGAVRSLPAGSKVTFMGTVRPTGTGVPATVTFTFRRLVNGVWKAVASRTATADATGRASTTWTFSTRGQWYVRALANPTTLNANSTWSQIERYSIR